MKKVYYYDNLPDGYSLDKTINTTTKSFTIKLSVVTTILLVAIMVLCIVFKLLTNKQDFELEFLPILYCFGIYLIYIVLHEITHGVVYKIFTKKKLSFGFIGSVAYCGVKDIYTTKTTAICAILAPFVLFNFIFIPLLVFVNNMNWYFGISFLFAAHIAGCSIDVYEALLILFKYHKKDLIMYDNGPEQYFYVKN